MLTNFTEQSPSWEAVVHLINNSPTFYGTRNFITVFAITRLWFVF